MNSSSLAATSSELPKQQQQQQQQNKHHASKNLPKKQSSLQRGLTSLLRKSGSNNNIINTDSTQQQQQQHKKNNNNNSSSSPEQSVLGMAPASMSATTTAATVVSEGATPTTTSTVSTPAATSTRSSVPTLPTTFVTLADQDSPDEDNDDYHEGSSSFSSSNSNSNSSPSSGNHGPYLATPHIVGQRSLSTPNLHTEGPSLLSSPINSPPGSPGHSAMATIVETEMPSLHLDEAAAVAAASNGNTPLILTLSPVGSPENSPKLTPRSSGLASSMTVFSLNGSSQRRSTRATAGSIGINGSLSNHGSNNSIHNNSNTSNNNNKAAMPPPPPLPDGSSKTLRSSKRKNVNRNSVVSLFDTSSSSMTLPTNFARKGSLPQDASGQANAKGLTSLFSAPQQDLTTPFSLTLAEFRLNDLYPRRQRRLLTVLHRLDFRLKEEGVVKRLSKEQLKGKPDKDALKPDRRSLTKDKKNSQGGFMAQRIPIFLRSKKAKKRTRPVILHNIEMAIRDRKPELALQYISLLPPNALKKKKKKAYNDLNHCMLLAMIYRMEKVAVELVDRGFPVDVNSPIVARGTGKKKKDSHLGGSGGGGGGGGGGGSSGKRCFY
ncbi:hypothetical protein DFQ26_005170 [Actinomortierella ambigua]|nr:hypothetical protein DFQ26_005170 [Actinomortierella ambigua]